jgi:anionic cell wall polymer biosynthesis LytR-Cps2A-Psr (LCP) family protein
MEVGDAVTLTGDEALAFCRSRKCDSDGDISRTRRQRQVIMSVLGKCQEIKLTELDDYVATFLPYLQTSYSTTDVIELGTRAITEAWPTYDVVQVVAPCEEARRGYSGSAWYWAVDYPLAAQTVQLAIYGESNITLEEDRVTSIDLLTRFGEYY